MSRGAQGVKLLALYGICYNMKDFLGLFMHMHKRVALKPKLLLTYAQEIP